MQANFFSYFSFCCCWNQIFEKGQFYLNTITRIQHFTTTLFLLFPFSPPWDVYKSPKNLTHILTGKVSRKIYDFAHSSIFSSFFTEDFSLWSGGFKKKTKRNQSLNLVAVEWFSCESSRTLNTSECFSDFLWTWNFHQSETGKNLKLWFKSRQVELNIPHISSLAKQHTNIISYLTIYGNCIQFKIRWFMWFNLDYRCCDKLYNIRSCTRKSMISMREEINSCKKWILKNLNSNTWTLA